MGMSIDGRAVWKVEEDTEKRWTYLAPFSGNVRDRDGNILADVDGDVFRTKSQLKKARDEVKPSLSAMRLFRRKGKRNI
jgi:hypothetical protein